MSDLFSDKTVQALLTQISLGNKAVVLKSIYDAALLDDRTAPMQLP